MIQITANRTRQNTNLYKIALLLVERIVYSLNRPFFLLRLVGHLF